MESIDDIKLFQNLISGITLDSKLYVLVMDISNTNQINDIHLTSIRSEPAILNKRRIVIGTLIEVYRTSHLREAGKLMNSFILCLIKTIKALSKLYDTQYSFFFSIGEKS